jgi:hypothetical protein
MLQTCLRVCNNVECCKCYYAGQQPQYAGIICVCLCFINIAAAAAVAAATAREAESYAVQVICNVLQQAAACWRLQDVFSPAAIHAAGDAAAVAGVLL